MSTQYGNSHVAGAGMTNPTPTPIGAIPPVRSAAGPNAAPRSSEFFIQVAGQLRALRGEAQDVNDAVGKAMRLFIGLPGVVATSHFHRDDEDQFLASTPLICKQSLADRARSWEPQLVQAVGKCVQKCQIVIERLSSDRFEIICSPVGDQRAPTAAFCVFVDSKIVDAPAMALLTQLAAAEFGVYGASARSVERGALDHFLRTAPSAQLNDTSYQDLAAALESTLRVSQVLIGTKQGRGQCRLQAASGVASIVRPSALVTLSEEVLAEAALQEAAKICDARDPTSLNPSQTQLIQLLRAGRIIVGPLRDASGIAVGAWIIVDDGTASVTPRAVPLLEQSQALAPVIAGITSLLYQARPSLPGRVWRRAKNTFWGKRRRTSIAVATAVSIILTLPWPYSVRCDCELQPVKRRYVAAPYDGRLEEVLVKPGDLVSAGQVLARMDRSELEWRMAAQDAEYQRASKQHDTSLAQRETSEVQVARLEMQRLSAERSMLKDRAKNLEIKSPIEGIVLAGDPKKLEGARLTIGQTLFETGPLEQMLVEVFIPHDEVAHFQPGNKTVVRLDALPQRKFTGEVLRISPQSESYEGQNVFVAEVELENPDRLLRPGMIGRGRVTTSAHMLAWNLFHRPFFRLVRLIRW